MHASNQILHQTLSHTLRHVLSRPPSRTRTAAVAAAVAIVCAVAVTVLSTPAPAHAEQRHLVALGDSYASGLGTRAYDPDSGSCKRSSYAYPAIDAGRIGATLSFKACAGATTADVRDDQLGPLSAGTTDVTITVGGNDVGFRHVITECAMPRWASDCNGAIDDARTTIRHPLPRRLNHLYRAVHALAPSANVVVVGYPRVFNGEDCNARTFFSPAEEARLNATADLLDRTTRARAVAHGFAFVDPRRAFTGHAVCDDPEWINGLSRPVSESYHPNRKGQRHYANLVSRRLDEAAGATRR
jgi:lysophospholipase L1-like esterase